MNNPEIANLISVIMPCYNSEKHLREALDSVLNQSYPDIELIVVDDGSTDTSQAILREYGTRITLIEQQNKGPYPARNAGLGVARGEYIAFHDADDYWDPECLLKLHNLLTSEQADLVYCGWQNVGKKNSLADKPYIPNSYEAGSIAEEFLAGCPWPIHAALSTHALIARVSGFSERYRTALDYDLWLRIAAKTSNMVRLPEALAYYRWHGEGQISSVKWEQVLNAWNVRRDFVRENPGLVKHLDKKVLNDKVHGSLRKAAFAAYWGRDLVSARRLFRTLLFTGYWTAGELRYLLPSLLTAGLYEKLVRAADLSSADTVH